MKSPRLSALRTAVDAAPLPAALAALLLAILIIQLALPVEATLPQADVSMVRKLADSSITLPPAATPPQLARRNPFAPGGGRAAPAAEQADITLLGLARSARGAVAVLSSGSQVASLAPGERLGGWRLLSVGRDGAIVAGPAGRRTLRIGQSAAPPAMQAPPAAEDIAE